MADLHPAKTQTQAGGAPADVPRRAGGILRSLRYRNYRLFFTGQIISLTGTWMQMTALGWLIYRVFESEFLLGALSFAAQLPTLLLAPIGGVMADRWDRRKALVVTQTLAMAQAFALAAITLGDQIAVWNLVLLAMFMGAVGAFDIPTRQAFVVQMIEDRRDLSNAIALNSSIVNGARLIGPLLAGLIVKAWNEGGCFLVNGLSFLAVIAALLAMRPGPQAPRARQGHALREMRESFRYAWHVVPVRLLLMLLAAISMFSVSMMVLLPVFAKDVLGGDSTTFAMLMGAAGAGALGGAAFLASRRTILGLAEIIAAAAGVFGAGLIAFSLSRWLWLSLGLMMVNGLSMMILLAAVNTVLQTIVDEDKRGRVMSLWAISFMGMAPLGSLLAGVLAERISASRTVLLAGAGCLAAAGLFASRLPVFRRDVAPVFVRLGLLPTPLGGVQPVGGPATDPPDKPDGVSRG